MGLECANAIWRHEDFLSVVPIGGAIVHPRWWRLQPTKGNGCVSPRRAPPMKGPRRCNPILKELEGPTKDRSASWRRFCKVDIITSTLHNRKGYIHKAYKTDQKDSHSYAQWAGSPQVTLWSNNWWWTPCSCASNDSLPNTQLSLTDLAMVERWFEWKPTWGRLEI